MQISAAITEKSLFYHSFVNITAIAKNMVSIPLFYGLMIIIKVYLNASEPYLFAYNEIQVLALFGIFHVVNCLLNNLCNIKPTMTDVIGYNTSVHFSTLHKLHVSCLLNISCLKYFINYSCFQLA